MQAIGYYECKLKHDNSLIVVNGVALFFLKKHICGTFEVQKGRVNLCPVTMNINF